MPELKLETVNYVVEYGYNNRTKKYGIFIKAKEKGGAKAFHTQFNLLDFNNNIIGMPDITEQVARYIIAHFDLKGDTESFNIYQNELESKDLKNRKSICADQVRHQITIPEKSFTATGDKLFYHWPIFKKFKETGFQSIIRATLTLHQLCSSKCHYCSTIRRNKADSITLNDAKAFIHKLYFDQAEFNINQFPEYNRDYQKITGSDIRLKSLILSGGGQPNLWPYFEEFVDWCSQLDIDMGLITNGFPKKVNENIYRKFKWIRISITPEDASPFYVDGKFNRQYMPESIKNNPNIKVGLSYVYGPWTTDDILLRIGDVLNRFGFDYCRVLTDCNLTRDAQLVAHKNLAEHLFNLKLIDENGKPTSNFFHQLKYHGSKKEAHELWKEEFCYLQIYNTFWDTTGHSEFGYSYCYACDSITVLAEESESGIKSSERKFNYEKWGTVKNIEVEKLFNEPHKKYFNPQRICSSCLFMRNNQVVKDLVLMKNHDKIELSHSLEHVNFP